MTFDGHVHDPIYCKMIIIAIFYMQSKDTNTQCVLWWKLKKVMVKKGVINPNFKSFMADIVQAN
jgi:hypothetical protein